MVEEAVDTVEEAEEVSSWGSDEVTARELIELTVVSSEGAKVAEILGAFKSGCSEVILTNWSI